MSKDKGGKPANTFNFGEIGSIDTVGEKKEVHGGDLVEGDQDKSTHVDTGGGDVHGGIGNQNSKQDNPWSGVNDRVEEFLTVLNGNAPDLSIEQLTAATEFPLASPETVSQETKELTSDDMSAMITEFEDTPPTFENNEDHPEIVQGLFSREATAETPLTVEEQRGFFSRLYSCASKHVGELDVASLAGGVADGIELVQNAMSFPYNVAHFICRRIADSKK